jgi:hypothetical protein
MKDAVFIIPKPSLMQEAVRIIDELDISGRVPMCRETFTSMSSLSVDLFF